MSAVGPTGANGTGERAGGPRRELAYAVLASVAGAGLALYAATRTWSVELTPRPPLPPLRDTHTGGALLPWLSALALVGLAGAGAVLATRGAVRRVLGIVLLLIALGVATGGAYGVVALDRGEGSAAWPVLCAIGGVLAAAGGALTAARGPRWPVMGARYERGATRRSHSDDGAPAAGERAAGSGQPEVAGGRLDARRTIQAWDALDRGEDPTVPGAPDSR